MVREETLRYLQQHQVMTLATTGTDGVWAAAVFYAVTDAFHLYFLSAGHTRHAQHIAVSPSVAATVQENYTDWATIQGVQLSGEVTLLAGEMRETAVSFYRQRYPFLATAPPPVQRAFAKVNWYRLIPSTLYFIDNRKGFGHRDRVI